MVGDVLVILSDWGLIGRIRDVNGDLCTVAATFAVFDLIDEGILATESGIRLVGERPVFIERHGTVLRRL